VTLRLSLGPVTHDIPDLSGSTVADATTSLHQLHFVVRTAAHGKYSAVAKGLVVSSTPAPGTSLAEGKTIQLVLSRGPAPVPVPDVHGMSVDDATQALTKVGLTVGKTSQRFSNGVPNGDVITTKPRIGTKVSHGGSVDLVLSKGPKLYPVPDVTGEGVNQAVRDIRAAGFTPKPEQAFPGGPGDVFRESPSGQQPKGATIELDYF
jgi:serine/threonine-protein kinase